MPRPGIVTDYRKCGTCGARTILARCERAEIVLDYETSPFGTIAAQHLPSGAWLATRLSQGDQPIHGVEKRYAEHECGGAG